MNKSKSSKGHQDSQGTGPRGWTTGLDHMLDGSKRLKEAGLFRLRKGKIMGDPATFFNCLWKDIEKA